MTIVAWPGYHGAVLRAMRNRIAMPVPDRETPHIEHRSARLPTTRVASRLFVTLFAGAYTLLLVDLGTAGQLALRTAPGACPALIVEVPG